MGQYYNPKRSQNWNFGGKNWRLSRSKLDLFIECPKCFYIDNKLGVKRPPGYPFNINSTIDHLLKKEFDLHRKAGTPHPLMEKYGIEAVPFQHKMMDQWRDNFKGVEAVHEPTGLVVFGAVDDIWVDKSGKLYVVDYKATSKDEEVNLDAEWQDGYKRQMEVYQWLLRENGFDVSNTGYFVYANARRDKDTFEANLEFRVKIISYEGDDSWIDGALKDAHECLKHHEVPKAHPDCDYCKYKDATHEVSKDREQKVQIDTLF